MAILFLFMLSIISSSISQYWQKKTAMYFDANPDIGTAEKLLSRPVIFSVIFLAIGALAWLAVLSSWDVSSAYPLLSINFIMMLLLSRFVFNEAISVTQWFGVSVIVLGVALLAGGATWLQ